MGLITPPLSRKTEEAVAKDMNRLFNLFLPEIRSAMKAREPESIWVQEPEVVHLFYALQGSLQTLREPEGRILRNVDTDFLGVSRATIWTTEAWLFFLALEFVNSGRIEMVNDLMRKSFPKMFESPLIYGVEAVDILRRVEARLPSGRQIPEEAEELLMLV